VDAVISIEGLTKSHGKSWGIRDADLTANAKARTSAFSVPSMAVRQGGIR
jgi:hypothetical protein